ncbi:hypothetical protein M5689_010954 [Euphorbia peplus]|nr:hypothetical protein M5689_010954 [Euphorbia peplus]
MTNHMDSNKEVVIIVVNFLVQSKGKFEALSLHKLDKLVHFVLHKVKPADEESSGQLGHIISKVAMQPNLVECLVVTSVDFIGSGELYTFQHGIHNAKIVGHGSYVNRWIYEQILGQLEEF